MSDVAAALAVLAIAIHPEDPVLAFMTLVSMAILLGEAAVLFGIVVLVLAVEQWRGSDAVQVATDWQDDPAQMGDLPALPRGLRGAP